MNKLLPIVALLLSSCQIGPNFYELETPNKQREEVGSRGYHGASHTGIGYLSSVEACMLAKNAEEMTDEEISEASDYPRYDGNGYSDSVWYAENAEELAAQQVFQCDDGDVIIVDDNGDIIVLENPSKSCYSCVNVAQDGQTYTVDGHGCVNY